MKILIIMPIFEKHWLLMDKFCVDELGGEVVKNELSR